MTRECECRLCRAILERPSTAKALGISAAVVAERNPRLAAAIGAAGNSTEDERAPSAAGASPPPVS